MPEEKEPHYFATDMPVYRRMTSEKEYLALFDEANSAQQAIGEASVWYLFSRTAIPSIMRFNADAKFLVFFRNPVEFVQSLHAQFAYNNGRDPDFPAAWESAEMQARLVAYGSFGEQFSRLRAIVPKNQYLVIVQDDMKISPRTEYLRALEFLGLRDDGRTEFVNFNARKVHRSPYLARFTTRTPQALARAWQLTKRVTGIKRLGLMDRIHTLNTKRQRKTPISPELRQSVRDTFAGEIASLGEQLGDRKSTRLNSSHYS